VEAIATIIQIQDKFIHPTLNLEHPISMQSNIVKGNSQANFIRFALSNSFGFGGINSSIILAKNLSE
jgi:malonyl-ACP decarboxylase